MEGKPDRTCLDPAIEILEVVANNLRDDFRKFYIPLRSTASDLRFLKMLVWGWALCQESYNDPPRRATLDTVVAKLCQMLDEINAKLANDEGLKMNPQQLVSRLRKPIEECKGYAKEYFSIILGSPLHFKHGKFTNEDAGETVSFVDFVRQNLYVLQQQIYSHTVFATGGWCVEVQQQISSLQRKLEKFEYPNSIHVSITRVNMVSKVMHYTQRWAHRISCLACLYWIDWEAYLMEHILQTLMDQMLLYDPGVISSCLEDTMIPQILGRCFDSRFGKLWMPPEEDDHTIDVETLREGLLFMSSFVLHPPHEHQEHRDRILGQMDAIINKLPSLTRLAISNNHETEQGHTPNIAKLFDFMERINGVKDEVREIYCAMPHSSELNSANTTPIGLLDSLLKTFKNMSNTELKVVPSIKC